ncbi:MAG: hypothetical protein FWD33_01935 [Alphaproteobacteria bacterium]|nr:hypothetical protein [Alphaproteobacteria bacterium]
MMYNWNEVQKYCTGAPRSIPGVELAVMSEAEIALAITMLETAISDCESEVKITQKCLDEKIGADWSTIEEWHQDIRFCNSCASQAREALGIWHAYSMIINDGDPRVKAVASKYLERAYAA